MNLFDLEKCLESAVILVDSREQPSERAEKRYKALGLPYKRCTLDYGDYAINCTLPSNKPLYDVSKRVYADVVVERKMNLDELAGCFTKGRKRFQKEFERAQEHGAKIYLLIENASWENLLNGRYRSRFNQNAFKASITAYMARYNAQVIMCKSETSGKLIREILYRELKERLNGMGER